MYSVNEEGNQVLDENGNPIPLSSPPLDPPKDEETYMEISLLYFGIYIKVASFKYSHKFIFHIIYCNIIHQLLKITNIVF